MWLSVTEITALRKAALDSGLIIDVQRSLLLQGIPAGFRASLVLDPTPLNQFSLDLGRLNDVERLTDGLVPLVQYLQNAADQLEVRSLPQAEIFKRVANEVGNKVRGAAVAALPAPSSLPEIREAIVGRDDMVDFVFVSRALDAGRAVARILAPRFERGNPVRLEDGKPWLARGTTWIIGPRLVITNHHVVNARFDGEPDASEPDLGLQAKNATVEFDFDQTDAVKKTFAVESLVQASKTLDYAILRLEQDPCRNALVLNPDRLKLTATSYAAVNIIQHPRGQAKRIALRNNLVIATDEDVIRYFTDTDFGSSGSPVCDDNWRVVGLHRGAKYASGVSYQGKDTAYVNFGSQIQAIMADVKSANNTVYQEIVGA